VIKQLIKYEMTDNRHHHHHHCRQIRRLFDGLLGGYIESEENLDQAGSCFVFGEAVVSGDALVYDDAWVFGNARVYGDALVCGGAKVSGDA